MPYDPDKPAQISISGNRKTLIQDGIEYHFVSHEPTDPVAAAKREAELEAERLSKAPLVTLLPSETLQEIGAGYFIAVSDNGERGPWKRARVAHLLADGPKAEAPKAAESNGEPLVLKDGETIRETGQNTGWYHILGADGEPTGPAVRKNKVAHLLEGV